MGKEGFDMFIMQLACTVYCPVVCNASFAHLEAAAAKHNGLLGTWP